MKGFETEAPKLTWAGVCDAPSVGQPTHPPSCGWITRTARLADTSGHSGTHTVRDTDRTLVSGWQTVTG
jgi:hypothetical protein